MRRRASRLIDVGLTTAWLALSTRAGAQACCAGSSAITPGRLGLHDDALVGLQLRGTGLIGSYDQRGRYRRSDPESSELGLQENLVAALRLLGHGQLSVLVPFVQTRRSVAVRSEFGGGLGDVNLSLRYDAFDARRSAVFPGVAWLVGLTLPTGVPVESASNVLATDATGVGAVQANGGVALEQVFGAWTVSAAGLVAKRWARDVQDVRQTLGEEWTFVAAGAYAFESEVALAGAASYSIEGDASIAGVEQPDTSRRLLTATATAVVPLSDSVRLQGAAFVTPPVSSLAANQTALAGLSFMLVYAWL